jgi:LysM repeat protein
MVLKRGFILFSIILVVVILGACVRSASTPPANVVPPPTATTPGENQPAAVGGETQPSAVSGETQPGTEGGEAQPETPGGETPGEAPKGEPVATNAVLQQLEAFVTQTAAAAQLSGAQPVSTEQPGITTSETPASSETGQQPGGAEPGSQAPTEESAAAQQTPVAPESGSEHPAATATTEQQAGGQQPSGQQPTLQPTATPTQVTTSGGQSSTAPSGGNISITATPGIPSSYTLQTGEFPYCIARRFNVNPFELLSINGLSTSSLVRGGTTLRIPKTGNHFPGERALMAHPTTYTVKSGQNIYEIACAFGDVSPDMIALANGLKEPYTLTAGQNLFIP